MQDPKTKPVARHTRFGGGHPAVLHYRGRDYDCEAINLSRSGVLLGGPLPWPADEQVQFSLRSLEGDLTVELQGLRARVGEDADRHGTFLALEFVDLSDEQKGSLERLFARVVEKKLPSGSLDALRPGLPPQEIRSTLESVPVAQRVALAARAGPREREYLRLDSHPQVLESLVRNPNLTVAEARGIAESRNAILGTLETLAGDSRWRGDAVLPVLLATHPMASVPFAERMLASMNVPQLKRVLARPTLKPSLRDMIKKRIVRGR